MSPAVRQEIAGIAEDRVSSASALVLRGIALLRRAESRAALEEIARELCLAQPAMAGFRTAGALALRAEDPAAALDRLSQRLDRAPAIVARLAADLILLGRGDTAGSLRLVTCSRSRMIETALLEMARRTRLIVSCGEGRPAREGLGLASALASNGVEVELFSDAGLSAAVPAADAVVVGADALSGDRFINKVGTGALCALAAAVGIPVYLLTGREKVVQAGELPDTLREGPADEIQSSTNPRLIVRNPYFETISTRFLSAVVTDAGVLPADEVEAARLI